MLLANKYPFNWNSVFTQDASTPPQAQTSKTKLYALIAAAAVLLIVVGIVIFQRPAAEKIFAMYKKSVVLIYGEYYYNVISNGRIIAKYPSGDDTIAYTGTGFIVSNDGKIITNRHVAYPWDYAEEIIAKIKRKYQREVRVEGELVFIGCLLNDTHVTNIMDDLMPCTPLKHGSTTDIDVALIQINSKALPAGVERIVDLNRAVMSDDAYVIGAPVYSIGFPAGFNLGMTDQGIEANNQDGKITQVRGDIEFGHNISVTVGASGSPVFNKYGHLIGIVHAGFTETQGYNLAIKAKYAVELVR